MLPLNRCMPAPQTKLRFLAAKPFHELLQSRSITLSSLVHAEVSFPALALLAPPHYTAHMSDVTQLLEAIQRGQPQAADALLPLVYDELRQLARSKFQQEKPGQTLQATALVHEAYLRLVGEREQRTVNSVEAGKWNGRGHFFAAAAEAMRRILVEQARRKRQVQRGGDLERVPLEIAEPVHEKPGDDLLAVDESLARLEAQDPLAASVVKLRYFAGLSMPETAEALGISLRTAERNWTYARTWLHRELG
jgi:RNA polymerase sigma factor (TIGR02999 family)